MWSGRVPTLAPACGRPCMPRCGFGFGFANEATEGEHYACISAQCD